MGTPEYANLSTQGKIVLRANIYQKYVQPAYTKAGAKPPDLKAWLLGSTSEEIGKVNPEEFFASKSIQAAHDLGHSFIDGVHTIVQAGAALSHADFSQDVGLAKFFVRHIPFAEVVDTSAQMKAAGDKFYENLATHGPTNAIATGSDFYLQSHPRSGFLASAPSWTGEQLAMLPLYEAINPATEGAVAAAGSVAAKILPKTFTETLLGTKVGQGVASRLMSAVAKFTGRRAEDAATGFATGKLLNEDNAQATSDAASWALMGGLAEGVTPAIRGAATLHGKAMNAGMPEIQSILHVTDDTIKDWDANKFAVGGRPFAEQVHQAAVVEEEGLHTPATDREKTDPVLHKVIQGDRHTLNALAQRHYGETYGNLSRGKRDIIKQRKLELLAEAEHELPARLPDLQAAEVQEDINKQVATSPRFAAVQQGLQELSKKIPGIFEDTTKIVTEGKVEANKVVTGMKNPTRKAAELPSTRESVKPVDTEDLTLEGFASRREDTVAYFRNREPRRAADGTLIGNRDKRPWNVRLKAENQEQFVETLKEADGNHINFENPYHRMLYHWANRDSLPEPVRDKLLREMKKYNENQKEPQFLNSKELSAASDRLLVHLMKLVNTGRLVNEGNVFKSTNLNDAHFTKWQTQLSTEIEDKEWKALQHSLKLYPAQKDTLERGLLLLQKDRKANKSAEEWFKFTTAIHDHLYGNLGKDLK